MSVKGSRSQKGPYVGPRPIRKGDPFYGRTQEIYELTNRIWANHTVLLHSISGAGKSSLLQAGLIPEMIENQDFRVLSIARVNQPKPQGVEGNRYQFSVLNSFEKDRPVKRRLPLERLSQMDLIKYLEGRQWGLPLKRRKRTLLIFDQFEEIFTVDPLKLDEKEAFFAWLMPALYDVRCWALFAMRDDYVGAIEPYLDYFPDRLAARFRLEFLRREVALEAIQKPAEKYGKTFELAAAQKLAADLSEITVQDEQGVIQKVPGLYIEPIHLQVVCLKIWNALQSSQAVISLKEIQEYGDIESALAGYYNDVLNSKSVAGRDRSRQRAVRDWIEHQLTTPLGQRSPARQDTITTYGLDLEIIKELVDKYLVRADKRLNATYYELAHDRLVRPIQRANQEWRQAGRNLEGWQQKAEEWAATHDPKLLLDSDTFQTIKAVFNPSRAVPVDRDFLRACEESLEVARQAEKRRWEDQKRLDRVVRGVNLEETGWGVIFPRNTNPDIYKALEELLALRKEQAGKNRPDFYHEFAYDKGYDPGSESRPAESAQDFLKRHKAVAGLSFPEKMPYYLLIVGSPSEIPYEFQYELDGQYAVGRIFFDTLQEYQSYARSVVASESGSFRLPNTLTVFSPPLPDDPEPERVAKNLARPLVDRLRKRPVHWHIDFYAGEKANLAELEDHLGGQNSPTLLLVTGGGQAAEPADPQFDELMGAIACSVYQARLSPYTSPEQTVFTKTQVRDQASLLGMVAILGSDFSAGAPSFSELDFEPDRMLLAEEPVLARLPQRLLGHQQGGALAVIAHVDRLWSSRAAEGTADIALDVELYQDISERLMLGFTAGATMEAINRRTDQALGVIQELLNQQFYQPASIDRSILVEKMRAAVLVRNYVLLGDPAARLPIDPRLSFQPDQLPKRRPNIQAVVPLSPTVQITPQPAVKRSFGKEAPPALAQATWLLSGLQVGSGKYAFGPYTTIDLMDLVDADPEMQKSALPGSTF